MAKVRPIHGITYRPDLASTSQVLSPPYDVLDGDAVARLYDADPHNAVRIEFGRQHNDDVEGQNDRYTRATGYLTDWLTERVLLEDDQPVLYFSEHTFNVSNGHGTAIRRGVFVGLAPGSGTTTWARDGIRPHERTFSGPKVDRLKLLQATGVQTSPVFGFWDSASAVDAILLKVGTQAADFVTTMDGELGPETHRLWRVRASRDVTEILRFLDSATLYIADGHHRYETTVAYIREERKRTGAVLVYLCAAQDPGLFVLPTHRILTSPQLTLTSSADIPALLNNNWRVQSVTSLAELMQSHEVRSEQSIGVVTAHSMAVISRNIEATLPRAQRLAVWALHNEVLPALGVHEGQVSFTRSEFDAVDRVGRGQASVVFLLPSPTTADIMAVADEGDVMPQKSTYFYPKVPSGLVMTRI